MRTKHDIISGDSRQMDFLEDSSVQLVVTSPTVLATKGLWN